MAWSLTTRTRSRRRVVPATVAGAALLGWAGMLPAVAAEVEFTITDERITESSGLATDPDADRYWTVNDSGDRGVAYALDEEGDTEGTLEFRADPVDVEAVAVHAGRLYVADIGDNRARRDLVTVYAIDDAAPGEQPVVYQAYDFSYPDGPRDAETLLVDGNDRLFVVTKGAEGGIYAAPESPSRQAVNELARVADAPAYVTDGTFLPDGRIALRTYTAVEVLDPDSYQTVARAATPPQQQGESLSTTLDSDALLIGSEGERSEVLRIGVPSKLEEVPSSSPSPPPDGPASPTPGAPTGAPASPSTAAGEPAEDDPPTGGAAPTAGRRGTLAAIGIAAAIAAVAGAVVVLVRRP